MSNVQKTDEGLPKKDDKDPIFSPITELLERFGVLTQRNEEILELLKKLILKKEIPDDFTFTKIQRASTTAIVQPKTPDIQIKNPRDEETSVREISCTLDSVFRTDGNLLIMIDGAPVYENNAVADFTDITELNVPLAKGKTVKRQKKGVEVFIWNGVDSDQISLTVQVTFGETEIGDKK